MVAIDNFDSAQLDKMSKPELKKRQVLMAGSFLYTLFLIYVTHPPTSLGSFLIFFVRGKSTLGITNRRYYIILWLYTTFYAHSVLLRYLTIMKILILITIYIYMLSTCTS